MTNFDSHFEFIKTYLPKYLSPEQQEDLFSSIKEDFPYSSNPNKIYIRLRGIEHFYQGDTIIDVPFAIWDSKNTNFATRFFTGAILSNTCDINPQNRRLDESNIIVSAVFSLSKYIEILKKRKISEKRIDSFLENLKANRITNLFYLPGIINNSEVILQESFVRFDFITSVPTSMIYNKKYNQNYYPLGSRKSSFSNYGFYLFLLKLSIHFCRFREGVFRSS